MTHGLAGSYASMSDEQGNYGPYVRFQPIPDYKSPLQTCLTVVRAGSSSFMTHHKFYSLSIVKK